MLVVLAACGGQTASTTNLPTTTAASPLVLTGTVDLPIGGFDGDRETNCWGLKGMTTYEKVPTSWLQTETGTPSESEISRAVSITPALNGLIRRVGITLRLN